MNPVNEPVRERNNGATQVGPPVLFEGVVKRFGRIEVVHGINLDVQAGRTTCIIGPSGSGKSTLLRMVNGLERPDSGRVLVGAVDVTDPNVDLDALRGTVGMVFQHFNLFPHMTVLQNVTLGLRRVRRLNKETAERQAMDRLNEVGLADLASRRPNQISGGQQQRVAIARSLAMAPGVLLFDEVTSALDPELVKGVLDVIRHLASRGMTMIAVTHEMGFAQEVASHVVFMDRGRIVEQGSPSQMFEDPRTERLQTFLEQVL